MLLCCAVLCCAVLCCAVLCCAVLCCAVLCCAVLCCAVLCCAVPCQETTCMYVVSTTACAVINPQLCWSSHLCNWLTSCVAHEHNLPMCCTLPVALINSTCCCSFWKYVTTLDRQESRRYLEMLYHTKLRPLIADVPEAANQPSVSQSG